MLIICNGVEVEVEETPEQQEEREWYEDNYLDCQKGDIHGREKTVR